MATEVCDNSLIGTKLTDATSCKCDVQDTSKCAKDKYCVSNGTKNVCTTPLADKQKAPAADSSCCVTTTEKNAKYVPQNDYCLTTNGEVVQNCTNALNISDGKCACGAAETFCTEKGKPYCASNICLAAAEGNKTISTEQQFCGGVICNITSYCSVQNEKDHGGSAGAVCMATLNNNAAPTVNGYGYCQSTSDPGICYGKSTVCSTATGCTCVAGSQSYGVCKKDTKSCKLGQSFSIDSECVDPEKFASNPTVIPVAATNGVCGKTVMIQSPGQLCLSDKIYSVCAIGIAANVACACQVKENVISVVPKGTVCGVNDFACATHYEVNKAGDNCVKKSDSLATWAIVLISICAVLAVAGIIAGVVCCTKNKSKEKQKVANPDEGKMMSPSQ